MATDLIHIVLNLAAPPLTFFSLILFAPLFQLFKLFHSVLRGLFPEDITGKVVIVTGASSGIGEALAHEYGKRGACLVLAARRQRSLQEVAERAGDLGSLWYRQMFRIRMTAGGLLIKLKISRPHIHTRYCPLWPVPHGFAPGEIVPKRPLVYRVDHLVNNAGISSVSMLEETDDVTDFRGIMDTNFWGAVYMTRFAAPYLRNSRGRIVVLSSSASWLPQPRMSLYNASKAAILQFFETLRVEFGPDIGITITTPGFVESELTQGKFLNKGGKLVVDQEMRDVQVSVIPILKVDSCARSIVRSALRGDRSVTAPCWFQTTYIWQAFFPELEWLFRLIYLTGTGESSKDAIGKKLADLCVK